MEKQTEESTPTKLIIATCIVTASMIIGGILGSSHYKNKQGEFIDQNPKVKRVHEIVRSFPKSPYFLRNPEYRNQSINSTKEYIDLISQPEVIQGIDHTKNLESKSISCVMGGSLGALASWFGVGGVGCFYHNRIRKKRGDSFN